MDRNQPSNQKCSQEDCKLDFLDQLFFSRKKKNEIQLRFN
mgnify:CR=1 FL=1